MEAFSLTLNIFANSWSNLTTKTSFRILRTSRFQNCPWLLELTKNWRRYWGLKRRLPFKHHLVFFERGYMLQFIQVVFFFYFFNQFNINCFCSCRCDYPGHACSSYNRFNNISEARAPHQHQEKHCLQVQSSECSLKVRRMCLFSCCSNKCKRHLLF